MDQITESTDENKIQDEEIYYVKNEPVMPCAVNVLSKIGKSNKLILKAKGNAIPNAVAIANIITEKFLNGNSKVQKVTVDSEVLENMGKMISMIEIILVKTS